MSEAITIPFQHLRLHNDEFTNPRLEVDQAHARELALSIGRRGLLNRLIVAPISPSSPVASSSGVYLILAGQTRYHAIAMVLDWRRHLADDVLEHEHALFDARASELRDVPCEVNYDPDWDASALTDNLHRKDLTSYETARALAQMAHRRGCTGAELARMVGKSPSWISRHLTCWRQAGSELAAAWQRGLAFERVCELAALDVAAQAKALEPQPARAVRGPANRPGIDRVKARLAVLEENRAGIADGPWAQGALAALRWVAEGKGDGAFFTEEEP